jgi:hypothetical protein
MPKKVEESVKLEQFVAWENIFYHPFASLTRGHREHREKHLRFHSFFLCVLCAL